MSKYFCPPLYIWCTTFSPFSEIRLIGKMEMVKLKGEETRLKGLFNPPALCKSFEVVKHICHYLSSLVQFMGPMSSVICHKAWVRKCYVMSFKSLHAVMKIIRLGGEEEEEKKDYEWIQIALDFSPSARKKEICSRKACYHCTIGIDHR